MSSESQRRLKFSGLLYFPEWARLSSLSTKIVPAGKNSVFPWRLGAGEWGGILSFGKKNFPCFSLKTNLKEVSFQVSTP